MSVTFFVQESQDTSGKKLFVCRARIAQHPFNAWSILGQGESPGLATADCAKALADMIDFWVEDGGSLPWAVCETEGTR